MTKIIVTASTYPRWKNDELPMFVDEQLCYLKELYPEFDITLLAPHHIGAKYREQSDFGEIIRFRYFLPESMQDLVYPAIMPNLKQNKWLYLKIPFLFVSEFISLLSLVIKHKPDYIYSHWFLPQAVVGGIVGMLTNTKHVYTSHSSDVLIAKKLPVMGPWLVRMISKRAEKISVVSRRSQAKLSSYFSDIEWSELAKKVKILPMGVDASTISHPDPKEKLLKSYGYQDRNVVLFIGRLAEKKGVTYLLDAMAKYAEYDPKVLLIVAGDGPLSPLLKQQVDNLNLEHNVLFSGYTTGDKKCQFFKMCDIVVVPSIITSEGDAEGFPVVLMEAMATGKICIATDASGADDIVESGRDGFLIEQKSSTDIYQTMVTIDKMSEQEKRQMALSAKQKSKYFDWQNIVKQHVDHFFSNR